MARPKKQLNRRTDILDAGQVLFAEKGFEKTTIEEIARYIGIGKGSVYLDFENKDEILSAIVERFAKQLLEKEKKQAQMVKPPYLPELKKIFLINILDIFDMAISQVHTHIVRIHTSYQMRKKISYLIEERYKIIADLLEKANKNGEIKEFKNYINLSHLISVGLRGFYPPYSFEYAIDLREDLTKDEIRSLLKNDASIVIGILLEGLNGIERHIKETI